MSLDEILKNIGKTVDSIIFEYLKGEVNKLYEASKYLFTSGGKRLRPTIVILVSKLVNGNLESAYKLSAAVEVLHTFTLIHDDIMDNDTVRRGIPAVHVRYGVPMAILAGDLLHVKAFEILHDGLSLLDPIKINKGLKIFTKSIIKISEGQAMDMEFENRNDVSEMEYLNMIEKKTAYLFACSAYLGGLTGEVSDIDLEHLFNFGLNIGISFQIIDDILGLIGDEKELGKPVFSDLREGKKTILVIKALSESNEEERKIILKVLGNRNASKEDLEIAANIIKRLSLDYAYKKANEFSTRAIKELNYVKWKDTDSGKNLINLINFIVNRRK
jgi:geranylgeranyl diphosphate synthase type I